MYSDEEREQGFLTIEELAEQQRQARIAYERWLDELEAEHAHLDDSLWA